MKKSFISLVFILPVVLLRAQPLTSFPTDHDGFLKELNQYMTASKTESNVRTMDELEKMVKEGKISSPWLDQVVGTANVMLGRHMGAFPYFNHYLNAVMNAANSSRSDEQFDDWNTLTGQIIDNQKKGDNSDFLKFIEFSDGFFGNGALNSTPAKTWRVETTDYKFSYDNNKPAITFPLTTLIGQVKGDSVSIKQTSGTYYPLETKWAGKSGRVDWERVGFDPNRVYCTFNSYAINLSGFNYTIDTVTFYDLEYFKLPLKGKLMDKMVTGGDSVNMTYPRFESYDVGMTIKDLAPNVSYTGGFSLNGSKVLGYGTPDAKASLTFFARDGKTKILTAQAQNLSIRKGQDLAAEKAEVSIYFGTDSIYHPQLNLIYKIPKHEMRLLRSETAMGQAKFTDSYHNDEFQTDAIFWNLDSAVLNLKILSGVGKKPGVYESVNYFDKELLRKTQGVASYEPLYTLKRMCDKSGTRTVNVTEFARALSPNLQENEVKSLLYDLVGSGFILYNEDQGIIIVKDKAINYVLAKGKKIDYDIITIKSAPQSGNDYIDLKSSTIDLKGVYEVPISDSDYVYFRPRNNSISLQKDRNMEFDGMMYAGRMDMTGEKFKFEYLPFTVDLTKVDTMRINIPDSGKYDQDGNPILRPMKSKVEGIKGLLEIDAPINKSGRTRLPQFPRLYSKEKSYIYYDDSATAKGAYTRKNFFFELDPFRLDSLNNFSPDIINWQGRLVSGGIFPDLRDTVRLQKDESLGFKSEAPPEGFDLYQGKGKYYGKFELNYSGLQGEARITHSTADFTAADVRLYPDSLRATAGILSISKTFEGVKTPKVSGDSDLIFWTPLSDSMYISMKAKDKPFAMYDDTFTNFKGNLLLTGTGLNGSGTLDWDLATLTSKDFTFQTMNLSADTAALNIKTQNEKVSFKTPNVSAKVDFQTRIGEFKSNQLDIPTEFSYNQYITSINEFKWFMDEKILDFKAPPDGPGTYFTSTRPDQKGLQFLGKRATYNLVSSVLRVEQIPEIKVADASVVPDSGVVIIEGEAKMHQLHNAVIFADTINKFHRFDSATVDIYSKEELKAVGIYHYTTKDIRETLDFGDISTKRETETKRHKKVDTWKLVAKTNIDEKQNFILYPHIKFNGEAAIASEDSFINFKGYAKIDFKNPKANTSEFFIDQGINPQSLSLQYDTAVKNSNGNTLSTGIHLNPMPEAPAMYATIMSPKMNNKDLTIFKTEGLVTQLPSGEYLFGDEDRINGNSPRGNILRYDDKKGTVKAEGKFDLGAKFGLIKYTAAGSAEVKLDTGKYKLNLTLGLDAQMGDKIQERLEFYLAGDDADQPDLSYESDKQKATIYALTDAKEDKKMLEDFNTAPVLQKRPKNFDYNIVFSDVNFVFDSDDISLRSVGKIGVAIVGKKIINKKLDGNIEIQYKGGADVFTIYLQTGTKGWFYFEYRPGTLGILSSYDDVNNIITATAPDKRKIKGSNNRFYLYTLASSLNKDDFIAYMKDKASGISRPHPEPRAPQEEIPVSGDTSNINDLPGDTAGGAVQQQQPPVKEDVNQREINQIEQMKMSGESILSGPPPDRLKAKQDTAPSAPASPVKQDTASTRPDSANLNHEMQQNGMKQDSAQAATIPTAPVKQDTASNNSNKVPPNTQKQDTAQAITIPAPPVRQDTIVANPQTITQKQDTTQAATIQTPPVKQDTLAVNNGTVPTQAPPVKQDTVVTAGSVPTNSPTQPIVPKQDIAQPVPVQTPPVKQDTLAVNTGSVPPNAPTQPTTPKQDVAQPVPAQTPPVKQDTLAVNPGTVPPNAPTQPTAPKQDIAQPVPAQTPPVKQDTVAVNPSTVLPNAQTQPTTPKQDVVQPVPAQTPPVKQDTLAVNPNIAPSNAPTQPTAPKQDIVQPVPAQTPPVKEDTVAVNPGTVPPNAQTQPATPKQDIVQPVPAQTPPVKQDTVAVNSSSVPPNNPTQPTTPKQDVAQPVPVQTSPVKQDTVVVNPGTLPPNALTQPTIPKQDVAQPVPVQTSPVKHDTVAINPGTMPSNAQTQPTAPKQDIAQPAPAQTPPVKQDTMQPVQNMTQQPVVPPTPPVKQDTVQTIQNVTPGAVEIKQAAQPPQVPVQAMPPQDTVQPAQKLSTDSIPH